MRSPVVRYRPLGWPLPRRGFRGFAACSPAVSRRGRWRPSPPGRGAVAGGWGRGGRTGRRWAGGRWARPVGILGPTSSCRGRTTQLEEGAAAAAAATMSAGDAVCTGWLVKSPPERKLQRYVSRGATRPPSSPRVPTCGVALGAPGFYAPQRQPLPALGAAGKADPPKAKSHVDPVSQPRAGAR